MHDFEKLGVFYLGREYDAATQALAEEPLLYSSRDLTTHAVCVGMTGSGKTGLCVAMLEEAALDGIPALVVDPKGDIANLLLGRGSTRRTPRARACRWTSTRRAPPRPGARDWPSGARTATVSGGSATQRTWRSTRRAVSPACRCRC